MQIVSIATVLYAHELSYLQEAQMDPKASPTDHDGCTSPRHSSVSTDSICHIKYNSAVYDEDCYVVHAMGQLHPLFTAKHYRVVLTEYLLP